MSGTIQNLKINKQEYFEILQIARRLFQDDVRSGFDGPINKDFILLKALELFIIQKQGAASFEICLK